MNEDVIRGIIHHKQKRRWITCRRTVPGRSAQFADFPSNLDFRLIQMLQTLGISNLYSHQAKAFDFVEKGKNPVIVTPTASGKTLCYNLPVLNMIIRQPDTRALYLFPTKALAYDQLHELQKIRALTGPLFSASTYDGDTASTSRSMIRNECHIVLSNPDMLHQAILPHHTKWKRFFSNLRVIVIDELHTYRGVFGSHLGNVLRRLRRICRFYGSNPRYVMCSATLANPGELAEQITGSPAMLIEESGAPSGDRLMVFYNPPVVNTRDWIRRSYIAETVEFAKFLLDEGVQTIVFAGSRITVEIILSRLRRDAGDTVDEGRIRGYRGGYLPAERRRIEQGLRDGEVQCVVATSALELGVDIGNLDAVILSGYPGTIAGAWQRAGRAGRRSGTSLAIFIAASTPLDQFVIKHPDYFFRSSPEHARVNPNNLLVLLDHIRCAAFELPFAVGERFGDIAETEEFLRFMEEDGEMISSKDGWHYSGGRYPAAGVSLRSISSEQYVVVEGSGSRARIISQMDAASAARMVHPNAVYLHDGRQYRITGCDHDALRVTAEPSDYDYYTVPRDRSRVEILRIYETSRDLYTARYGEVNVISQVMGYQKLRLNTMEQVGGDTLDMPAFEINTMGYWIECDLDEVGTDAQGSLKDAISGLLGALIAIQSASSVILMSDPGDIGFCLNAADGAWSAQINHLGMLDLSVSEQMISPDCSVHLFLYDGYPGGVGFAEQLFRCRKEVYPAAKSLVEDCDCYAGCPACIGPAAGADLRIKSIAATLLFRLVQASA